MTLIFDLSLTNVNHASVQLDGHMLGSFDPQPLLEQNPFTNPHTAIEAYGDALYTALHGNIWPHAKLVMPAPHAEAMLAIRSSEPLLQAIPWEFLRIKQRWAIEDTLLVRLVPVTDQTRQALEQTPPDYSKPYRLLIQRCEPLLWIQKEAKIELNQLEVSQQLSSQAHDLQQSNPPLPLIWHELAPTTNAMIHAASTHRGVMLYHFIGHGVWHNGQPMLLFDDGVGRAKPVDFTKLIQSMRQRVQLAFLNACHSADTQQLQASLALRMCQNGIPVVLGMQGQSSITQTQQWATGFYATLAQGDDPLVALWNTRLALIDQEQTDVLAWMQPALYLIDQYQWHSSSFVATTPLPMTQFPRPALEQLSVAQQRFIGRRAELIDITSALGQAQVVTIRGAGGIGKTALVAALAQRIYWQFHDGIYAYSFANQTAPQLLEVLRWCAGWLNLQIEPSWNESQLMQQVLKRLRGRQYLLIIDNYETILWGLARQDEGLEHWESNPIITTSPEPQQANPQHREAARAIHEFWRIIANEGIKLLFTTRQSPVRLMGIIEKCYPPDNQLGQLQGLNQADGLALFKRWCNDTALRNKPPSDEIIAEILPKLGFSPLAIQLTARRWATLPNPQSTQFLADLNKHLVIAQVNDGSRHQLSLTANIRLSIEVLARPMQTALFQLSVLENPLIWSLNAAAIWGLQTNLKPGIRYEIDQAYPRLLQLEATSLIQLRDQEQANFAFQPAIIQGLRHLLTQDPWCHQMTQSIEQARKRYGQFAQQMAEYQHQQQIKGSLDTSAIAVLPDILAGRQYLDAGSAAKVAVQAAEMQQQFGLLNDAQQLLDEALNQIKNDDLLALRGTIFHTAAYLARVHGNFSKAEQLYRQALTIKDTLGDLKGRAETLHELAHLFRIRGYFAEAERLYRQSLTIKNDLGDHQGRANTLHELASLYQSRGELAEAERLYHESLEIDEQFDNRKGRAATIHALASIYQVHGALAEAEQLYHEALKIHDQIGNRKGRASTLHELASIHRIRGEMAEAEQLYHESLVIDAQLGDRKSRATTLHALAYLYQSRGDYPNAEQLYHESLEIKAEIEDIQGRAATLHELAYLHWVHGELNHAEQLYRESLAITTELGDLQGRAATLHALAQIFIVQGNFDQAEQLYHESLAINEHLGNMQGRAATLYALAEIFIVQGNFDQAEQLYHESLAINEHLGDLQGRATILHALAYLYQLQGKLATAEQLYRASLEIKTTIDDRKGIASTLVMLGQLQFQQGHVDAKAMVEQAHLIFLQLEAVREAEQTKAILDQLNQSV